MAKFDKFPGMLQGWGAARKPIPMAKHYLSLMVRCVLGTKSQLKIERRVSMMLVDPNQLKLH